MKKWHKIVIATGAGVLVCSGVGIVAAGPIACLFGSAGFLGAASTGTAISTLSGVALTNASLAAVGGGSLVAGGAGIAGGTAVIATTVGVAGGAATAAVANKTIKSDK